MTGCSVSGNPSYNSYCQSSASKSSTCGTNCRTYVSGFGFLCCSSECCGGSTPSSTSPSSTSPSSTSPSSTEETTVNNGVLDLDVLEQDFNQKLILYKQAYADYIGSLRSTTNDFIIKSDSIIIPSSTLLGTSVTTATSIAECKALCSSNALCKGANFTNTPSCQLYSTALGTSDVDINTDSSHKYTAIISSKSEYLNKIKLLNDQLIALNTQINTKVNAILPDANTINTRKISKAEILDRKYKLLLTEQRHIDDLIKKNIDINKEFQDSSIIVDQSDSWYMVWLLVAIFAILLAVKMLAFPEITISLKHVFLYIIGCIFIIATMHLNNSVSFMIFGIIVIFLLLLQFKMLPM